MIVASLIAVLICCAVSFLSRSAIKWSVLMLMGLATSFVLGSLGHYFLIWVVDLSMLMAMIGMRQELNREWQDGVVRLQIVLTTIYLVFAVFAERTPWLTGPLIDMGNLLYLVQVALVGFGGLTNSLRNYRYIRDQRKSGNKLPWLLTAWRMT